MMRKNQNHQKKCSDKYSEGVDLNRNFGYKFGLDNEGSSNDPCDEAYRGKKAFSEPEARAIRDLTYKYPRIRSAMNFHAYGDLWIRPFNYLKNKHSKIMKMKHKRLYGAYREFERTVYHPKGAK